jgi:hypothetical protein
VWRAIALLVWSLIVVMAANDYYVKPRLIGRGGDSHPLLMLVALIGGLSVFGIAGLIVGPVIMSLFVATARILEREREEDPLVSVSTSPPPPPTPATPEPDPDDTPSGVHDRGKAWAPSPLHRARAGFGGSPFAARHARSRRRSRRTR